MKQLISPLPELQKAFLAGFTEHFHLSATGFLYCLSNPEKFYDLTDLVIGPPVPLSIPGTLFNISTKDGLRKGTFIDFEF